MSITQLSPQFEIAFVVVWSIGRIKRLAGEVGAKRCRVFKGFLCAFAPLRLCVRNSFFPQKPQRGFEFFSCKEKWTKPATAAMSLQVTARRLRDGKAREMRRTLQSKLSGRAPCYLKLLTSDSSRSFANLLRRFSQRSSTSNLFLSVKGPKPERFDTTRFGYVK